MNSSRARARPRSLRSDCAPRRSWKSPASRGRSGSEGEGLVKRAYPALSDQYRDLAAAHAPASCYDGGARDPRPARHHGPNAECDAGNDAAALPLLTACRSAPGGASPGPIFDQARLRFAQGRASPPQARPVPFSATYGSPLSWSPGRGADAGSSPCLAPMRSSRMFGSTAPCRRLPRIWPRWKRASACFPAARGPGPGRRPVRRPGPGRWAEAKETIDRSLNNATEESEPGPPDSAAVIAGRFVLPRKVRQAPLRAGGGCCHWCGTGLAV